MNDKRTLRIVLVGAGVMVAVALWFVTLRYNLQGGFKQKIQTAVPAQASGALDDIDLKIKALKDKFKNNQGAIDQLLHQNQK